MGHILVRPALFVLVTLSLSLLASCSGLSGNPREQANGFVAEANQDIDEHNRLFQEARNDYAEAKDAVEKADDPSGEAERFTQTRQTMVEAQAKLKDAREPLSQIRDLDIDAELKDYAGILSEALDTQIAAEDREMEFYRILEEDPSLKDNRESAQGILDQVGDLYKRADDDYQRAQDLADANPELIKER